MCQLGYPVRETIPSAYSKLCLPTPVGEVLVLRKFKRSHYFLFTCNLEQRLRYGKGHSTLAVVPVVAVVICRDQFPSFFIALHNPGADDFDLISWSILSICFQKSHALNYPHATLYPAENCVFPVQPWRRGQGDEELTAVRVGPTVCHAQNSSSRVFQPFLNLILEFLAVDRASSSAGAGRIAGLDHKVGYDAVEDDVVVITPLRESREILAGLKTNQVSASDSFKREVVACCQPWVHVHCKALP